MPGRTIKGPSIQVRPEQSVRRDTEVGQTVAGGAEGIPDTDELIANARGVPTYMDDGTFVHERQTNVDTGHLTPDDRERFGLADGEDPKWKFSDEYCKSIGRWNNSVRNALRTAKRTGIRLVTVDGEPVHDGDNVLMAQPCKVNNARDRFVAEQRMDLRRQLKSSTRVKHDLDTPETEENQEALAEAIAKRREVEELQAQLSPTKGMSLEAGLRYEMDRRGCKTMKEVVESVARDEIQKRFPNVEMDKFALPQRETKKNRSTFVMGR